MWILDAVTDPEEGRGNHCLKLFQALETVFWRYWGGKWGTQGPRKTAAWFIYLRLDVHSWVGVWGTHLSDSIRGPGIPSTMGSNICFFSEARVQTHWETIFDQFQKQGFKHSRPNWRLPCLCLRIWKFQGTMVSCLAVRKGRPCVCFNLFDLQVPATILA